MMTTHTKRCIYCDSEGPFTDEHVFPAGMGGNDRSYILKDTVCGKCNSSFSKFETTLMRRSVVALARIFLQPSGRRKGEAPEIDTLETQVIDGRGRAIESDHSGSQIETLAQLIFIEDKISTTAKDTKNLEDFLKTLSALFLENELLIIKKLNQQKPWKFEVSTFKATNNNYIFDTKEVMPKPPKNGIWLSYGGSLDNNKETIPPRIFRRKKGEIILKTHDSTLIGKILGSAKRMLPEIIENSENPTFAQINNPLVCITAESWSDDCNRAIAKIGLNLLIHHIGKESASNSAFAKIKQSICKAHPPPPFALLPDQSNIKEDLFANIPKNNHCLLLAPLNISDSEIIILFSAILYGSIGVWAILSERADKEILPEPAYYLVDYIDNKIQTLNILDYTEKFNPLKMEQMRQALGQI